MTISFCTRSESYRKKKERSIENNLNRNAEAVSLRIFCKKGVLKILTIFTGKHLCRNLPFDKVGCLKPEIYLKKEYSACVFLVIKIIKILTDLDVKYL